MSKLSIYYIVKNEEARLAESLEKVVGLTDDLVVVDSGSTDRTVEIAESFGARVVFHEWRGFAVQKAYAANLCKNDWLLNLDADEVLSDEAVDSIREAMGRDDLDQYGGFKLRWIHVPPFPKHPMKYAPPQHLLRLYHHKRAGFEVKPHSIVDRPHVLEGKEGFLTGDVEHKRVLDLVQLERKYAVVSSDQAEDYVLHERRISSWRLFVEFPFKFLKYYFGRGNYRNGWYGYTVSIMGAYRNFMRFAKARESQVSPQLNVEGGPMRITQIMMAQGFGGAERAFVDTVLALASRGHKVQAICHAGFKKAFLLEHPNVDVFKVSAFSQYDVFGVWAIKKALRSFDTDVVHVHLNRAARLGGRASLLAGVPWVGTFHNYYPIKNYKKATAIVAITEDVKHWIVQQGVDGKKVVAVPNFSRIAPVDEVRSFLSNSFRFLSYGRYVKKKGFDVLLRAFRSLLDSGVDAHLTIGGQGPERKTLQRLAVELGVEDQVELGVWINDVQTALDAADVFVLPSLDEPFGIVMLEAMARGVSIVTTRTPGPSQVLSEETAWFAETGSVDSLADALIRASGDPKASQKKAETALGVYRGKYNECSVSPQLEAVYRSAIASD